MCCLAVVESGKSADLAVQLMTVFSSLSLGGWAHLSSVLLGSSDHCAERMLNCAHKTESAAAESISYSSTELLHLERTRALPLPCSGFNVWWRDDCVCVTNLPCTAAIALRRAVVFFRGGNHRSTRNRLLHASAAVAEGDHG